MSSSMMKTRVLWRLGTWMTPRRRLLATPLHPTLIMTAAGVISQDRVSYGSTCQRVHQRGNVGQAFDKHHSDPPSLFPMCVGMCPRWIGGRSFYLYLLWRICCSVLMSTEERGCSVLLCEVANHWQTEHTPSKGDGYAYVRRFNVIYQYHTIQGWGLLLSGAMCQQSRSHEGN